MSISILNRGGLSSSSGGGPSGSLKPELTVTAPSGSKLEISTGSGGSGGSANGDGMALYNGVMLPNINGVIDANTETTSVIVEIDLSQYGVQGRLFFLAGVQNGSSQNFACATSQDIIDLAVSSGLKAPGLNSWVAYDDELPSGFNVSPFWAGELVSSTESAPYYGLYSEPIPLDGMNVITWDGDTTGLESMSLGYKVSDEIVDKETAQNGIVVMSDNTISNTGMHFELSDDVFALEMGAVCIVYKDGVTIDGETIEHKGTYFLSAANYTKLFAYPASSGGDKQIVDTYTLGENETEHTFTVELGTYTVTGTLGEKSKSVDVVIDTVGQYSVEIDYKLWLYREGDECEDVTGGYSKVPIGTTTTNAAATKEAGRWYLDESMYYPNLISNNKINVTPYSKIYADIESTKSNKWHPWIGVLTARNIGDNYRALFMGIGTHGNEAGANRQIVSADIATVTGDYYIGAALTGSGSAGYVYSFWLE